MPYTEQQIIESLLSYLSAQPETEQGRLFRQAYDAMLVETLNDVVMQIAGPNAVNLSQEMQSNILKKFKEYIHPPIRTAVYAIAAVLFENSLNETRESNKENYNVRAIASELHMISQASQDYALKFEENLLNDALDLAKHCLEEEDIARPTTPGLN